MSTFDVTLILIFAFAIGSLVFVFLKDPVFILKSFLRGLKDSTSLNVRIVSLPIWGPFYIIDKIFNLKIFVNSFEDASEPQSIIFSDFIKFILIKANGPINIVSILHAFQAEYDRDVYDYSLEGCECKVAHHNEDIILTFNNQIKLSTIIQLILFIENSAPKNAMYNIKGIFLHAGEIEKSIFIFYNPSYTDILVGKTFTNERIYVDLSSEANADSSDMIYFNSNIDNFSNLNFEEFDTRVTGLKFTEISLSSV